MTRIRYARGRSSLGEFLAAVSDRGLVTFEFERPGVEQAAALGERFPDAAVEEDAGGTAATVAALARLVDEPGRDPGLALDPSGSDYEKKVWDLLRRSGPSSHSWDMTPLRSRRRCPSGWRPRGEC